MFNPYGKTIQISIQDFLQIQVVDFYWLPEYFTRGFTPWCEKMNEMKLKIVECLHLFNESLIFFWYRRGGDSVKQKGEAGQLSWRPFV